ncbi:tungsten ABC transporter substrate-binding protein [Vibrio sp. 1-1(7)]|uniref:substrate-binding domain-containing protein n=2 Tax=Vibrio TaxID=662 RepID=UPI000C16E9E3|nr:tungsten ABC transporter substrate-binding protein [Vibrio sp. 1-1(7)]NNN71540.1 tungsten ABC transporter substrate-binding protein [Vibrio sp. 12-2(3-a)]
MIKIFVQLMLSLVMLTSGYALSADAPLRIRLATTTSTYHSGLLDYLLPEFKKDSGYTVDVIATGTGKALKMGEHGDVDLVMTHAPAAEALFVKQGYGVLPRKLMYNDFILVGPKADPAQVSDQPNVQQAFAHIAASSIPFISRGDDSGTHKKELIIWAKSQVKTDFPGYRSVGQGMGPTLNMASEMQAYTLTDRGTWLAYQSKLDLAMLYEGDSLLFNPYQVILVNPERYPSINYQGAKTFSDWLVNAKAQTLINNFTLNGQALFVANADK